MLQREMQKCYHAEALGDDGHSLCLWEFKKFSRRGDIKLGKAIEERAFQAESMVNMRFFITIIIANLLS